MQCYVNHRIRKNSTISFSAIFYENNCGLFLPSQSQDSKSETSLDIAHHNTCNLPGRASHYIVICRNVKQWRMSIDYVAVDDEVVSNVTATPKSAKSKKLTVLTEVCKWYLKLCHVNLSDTEFYSALRS